MLEKTHEYFMKEALKEAKRALDKDEVPVGAIIVCNDQIIARAHNLTEMLTDVTAHAEMQAFTSATSYIGGKYLSGCTLYVTLEPCTMCAGASFWTQIGQIVFGAKDDKRGYHVNSKNALHKKTKVISGILEKQCSEILVKFFESKRSNP